MWAKEFWKSEATAHAAFCVGYLVKDAGTTPDGSTAGSLAIAGVGDFWDAAST